jgi:arylsulfatase A-like enzyme
MSDDQGWGDVAYNGNPVVKTPVLDGMARTGVRFDRFYAGGPVCSPTRGSCLTGRHPYRYGITWANYGYLRRQEVTLAEGLRQVGYRTGLFGKWHVGGLSLTLKEDDLMGDTAHPERYQPPWEHGFDACFTCMGNPTANPTIWCNGKYPGPYEYFMDRAIKPEENAETPGCYQWPYNFWNGPGQIAHDDLEGDTSRVIMDRAIDFISREASAGNPFLALVWFCTPHAPIAATDQFRALYPERPIREQHWFGCISAMDDQIGRLRAKLRELGIADNTLVWFCSDNGPSWVHEYNSAGPFRGKKGSLYEGGVRVPAILEWPEKIKAPRVLTVPCSTSDFFPTIQAITGFRVERQPLPLDGINVLPVIEGTVRERPSPIAFQSPLRGKTWEIEPGTKQQTLSDNRYKIFSDDAGKSYQLYDLVADPSERVDLAGKMPEQVAKMRDYLERWVRSCAASYAGEDYRQAGQKRG